MTQNATNGYKGRLAKVGIALERTLNQAATSPEYYIPWVDFNLKDNFETIQNESSFNNIAHYNDQQLAGVHSEGDISMKLWHRGLYYYLALIFGQLPEHTAGSDGAHTYKFTMANHNNHMAATVFNGRPDRSCKYPNVMLNEASMEWSPSDFAKLTMSMIGRRSQDIADSVITPAFANDAEFKPDTMELKMADSLTGLATAEVAKLIRSVSMKITKNVEGEQTSDSGQDYGVIMNGDLEATLSFEKRLVDTAYQNMMLNQTPMAVSFGFIDTKNKAGTNTNTALRFTFPKVMLSSYEPAFGLSDTASESFEGAAMFDLASGNLVTAELTTKYEYPTTSPSVDGD